MLLVVTPRVVVTAGGVFTRMMFKLMQSWHPGCTPLQTIGVIARGDVDALVEDTAAAPALWRRDGGGRAHQWCYERCLEDECKVTTKNLFNQGPWPYEDPPVAAGDDPLPMPSRCEPCSRAVGVKAPLPAARTSGSPLEAIPEDAEGDEWERASASVCSRANMG